MTKILVMDIADSLILGDGYHSDLFGSLVCHILSNLKHTNEVTPQQWLINFQLSNYAALERLVASEAWLGLTDDFVCHPILVMVLGFDIFGLMIYLLNMMNVLSLFDDAVLLLMSQYLEMVQGLVDRFGVSYLHHLEVLLVLEVQLGLIGPVEKQGRAAILRELMPKERRKSTCKKNDNDLKCPKY